MDIYLTDLENGDFIRFPMLPEEIKVRTGAIFASYTVLAIGDIKVPAGEELTGFAWKGILPGEIRKEEPYVAKWRNPHEIQGLWSIYRAKKKKLRLLVTETPINHDVYIENYDVDYKGGYGDYHYDIRFINAKDLKVEVVTAAIASEEETPPTAQERPAPPAGNHTVVSGDTLWAIAQKSYGNGSDYAKIYEANKDAIEAAAQSHGRSSSDNGHWIYPGTDLVIP